MITTKRDGFSLVEVIIAMMILGFGVLALAASTGYVMRHIRLAETRTERVHALSKSAEQLRATQFANLSTACGAFAYQTERYDVTCAVDRAGNPTRLLLTARGPGYQNGDFVPSMDHPMVLNIAQ